MQNRLQTYLPKPSITGALLFDFDHVLHHPELRDQADGNSYVINPDNSLYGTPYDPALISKIFKMATEQGYETYIVTGRPESQKDYIVSVLQPIIQIKLENIRCLGIEKYSPELGRLCIAGIKHSKCIEIQNIHQVELSHLAKDRLIFIDDDPQHLNPVKEAEYTTILAKGLHDHTHLHTVIELLTVTHVSTLGHFATSNHSPFSLENAFDQAEDVSPPEHKEYDTASNQR